MISLCMIVKNEQQNIAKCLKSVDNLVDEIIVVDTGSSDKTYEIAKEYTDNVYKFEWCDDFSKARNYSIEKASNDWILVLDADEVVEYFDKVKILSAISVKSKRIGRIKIVNVFGDSDQQKKYVERVSRLFNKRYYHYEGVIHEQLTDNNKEQITTWEVDLSANHLGYSEEIINRTGKLERNIKLLSKIIEKNEKDIYIYYQLGKSYYMKKDYLKAYECFEKALKFDIDFKLEYVEDLVESYGYALLNGNMVNKALEIKKYECYYYFSPDFNFLIGFINMKNGLFKEAVDYFKRCISDKDGKIEGINSYLPNYNIGVIYECLGYFDEALKYYNKCYKYKKAHNRIDTILEYLKNNKRF